MRNFVLTSELMTRGHPDKLCDQISDAAVDACLSSDEEGGAIAECSLASGVVFLSIRHRRELRFDPTALARRVIADVGYADGVFGDRTTVMLDAVYAPEGAGPLEAMRSGERPFGASHMATSFGYACDQTPERMPAAIWAAHRLSARLDALRAEDAAPWIGPDAQVQVAVRFENRRPVGLAGLALTFAEPNGPADLDAVRAAFWESAVLPCLEGAPLEPDENTRLVIRPTAGPGGPAAHAGLTGRKTADDGYGGYARQSGSALSGKDPSRIERVAAYAARQAALTVVAAGLAKECEVQLSYAPGDEGPMSVEIDSFDSGVMDDEKISKRLAKKIDFRVEAILERLALWELPRRREGRFFRDLATYGHFGRVDLAAPWEETPEAERLA